MSRFIIYCHTCRVTSKKYVGQAKFYRANMSAEQVLSARWKDGRGYAKCHGINNAITKYGKESFISEILEEVDSQDEANISERKWIAKLNTLEPNGYNIEIGGNKYPISQSTRAKMSAAHRKRWEGIPKHVRDEHMRKMSNAHKLKVSPERVREIALQASKASSLRSPEEKSASAKKRDANMTAAQKSQRVQACRSYVRTPESNKENARKIKEAWQSNWTPEERSALAHERELRKTPEARSAIAKKAAQSKSPELRSEISRKASIAAHARPFEERSASARKARASQLAKLTPEQLSATAKKIWESRRKNAKLKAKKTDNGEIKNVEK